MRTAPAVERSSAQPPGPLPHTPILVYYTTLRHTRGGACCCITGGMGKEMVKAFAAGGAHVVIASRKLENCQTLADEIEAHPDCSGRALPVAFNASDWDDCTALVELVVKEFGRIDVLVNNAGGSPLYPSLAEISEELFDSEKAPRRFVDPFAAAFR